MDSIYVIRFCRVPAEQRPVCIGKMNRAWEAKPHPKPGKMKTKTFCYHAQDVNM